MRDAAPELLPWLPLLAVPLDIAVPATLESSELDPQYPTMDFDVDRERDRLIAQG